VAVLASLFDEPGQKTVTVLVNRAGARYHRAECELTEAEMALRKFIIERDIPAAGSLDREQLRGAAAKSNGVFCANSAPTSNGSRALSPPTRRSASNLAKDEAIIKQHAEISGFPATKITEVRKMIDPTTEHGD